MGQNEGHKNGAGAGADGRGGEAGPAGPSQELAAGALIPAAAPGLQRAGGADEPPASTLASWATCYLHSEVAGIQSPNTLAAKTRDLAAFIRWYIEANGHDQIADWMPRDTQAFVGHLEDAGRCDAGPPSSARALST